MRVRVAWFAALLLLAAAPAGAQVTLDAAVTVGDTGTSTATTVSHTTGASGTWMAVIAASRVAGTPATVSAVTFGATSLAHRCSLLGGDANRERITIWDGTVPTSTTATVTVTWTGTNSNATVAVTSWNAVVGVGACASNSVAAGTSTSIAVASLATDLVVDGFGVQTSTGPTPGGSQTANYALFNDGASVIFSRGSRATGGAGATTMSWTGFAGGSGIVQIGYALQSVLPPTLPTGLRLLLGVGP